MPFDLALLTDVMWELYDMLFVGGDSNCGWVEFDAVSRWVNRGRLVERGTRFSDR